MILGVIDLDLQSPTELKKSKFHYTQFDDQIKYTGRRKHTYQPLLPRMFQGPYCFSLSILWTYFYTYSVPWSGFPQSQPSAHTMIWAAEGISAVNIVPVI